MHNIAPLQIFIMLYPHVISPSPEYQNYYLIPNGRLYLFPFELESNQAFDVSVIHTAGQTNQDHSLRIWISKTIGDGPVVHHPPHVSFWHANRMDGETVTVYDRDGSAPEDKTALLGLPPGNYFVSILNLSNQENAFSFSLTELV